jgi:V/A-type H+/Na+-transporting ATPase subunit K
MTSMIFGIVAMAISGCGSFMGMAVAATSALGVRTEKKEECPNLVLFVLMPFSQTLYGLVVMAMAVFLFKDKFPPMEDTLGVITSLVAAALIGVCIGGAALYQGKVGARACDTIGKTGLGKGEAIMYMGTIETVSLFMMVMTIVGMFIVL